MSQKSFMQFKVSSTDGKARLGEMQFPRGPVQTPAFMPVGTYGTVKGMLPRDIKEIGAEMILGNTFHLMLRPGTEIIKEHGDLHDFTQWHGPILTDSGGFQVFSLGDMRKISEEGVKFRSPIDGSPVFIDPEKSMQVQRDLGSDVVMIFDECTPYPATEIEAKESMELSLRWAYRSGDPALVISSGNTRCRMSSNLNDGPQKGCKLVLDRCLTGAFDARMLHYIIQCVDDTTLQILQCQFSGVVHHFFSSLIEFRGHFGGGIVVVAHLIILLARKTRKVVLEDITADAAIAGAEHCGLFNTVGLLSLTIDQTIYASRFLKSRLLLLTLKLLNR